MPDQEQTVESTDFDEDKDYASELENAETADSVDEDVDVAKQKEETEDGKGGAVVPSADFQSFAGEDVENDPDEDEKKSLEG